APSICGVGQGRAYPLIVTRMQSDRFSNQVELPNLAGTLTEDAIFGTPDPILIKGSQAVKKSYSVKNFAGEGHCPSPKQLDRNRVVGIQPVVAYAEATRGHTSRAVSGSSEPPLLERVRIAHRPIAIGPSHQKADASWRDTTSQELAIDIVQCPEGLGGETDIVIHEEHDFSSRMLKSPPSLKRKSRLWRSQVSHVQVSTGSTKSLS